MTEYEFPDITPDMTDEQIAQAEQEAEALLYRHNQNYGFEDSQNDLDGKVDNYSPSQPRDGDGQWTDGGGRWWLYQGFYWH